MLFQKFFCYNIIIYKWWKRKMIWLWPPEPLSSTKGFYQLSWRPIRLHLSIYHGMKKEPLAASKDDPLFWWSSFWINFFAVGDLPCHLPRGIDLSIHHAGPMLFPRLPDENFENFRQANQVSRGMSPSARLPQRMQQHPLREVSVEFCPMPLPLPRCNKFYW